MGMRLKKISDKMLEDIKAEIKLMLHEHRDVLRIKGVDTSKVTFDLREGYYGEAFGILRALKVLGYGYFGPCNLDAFEDNYPVKRFQNITRKEQNLSWLCNELEKEVLDEEGFYSDHRCERCFKKYGRDTKSMLDEKNE